MDTAEQTWDRLRRWWLAHSPAARLAAGYVAIIMVISLLFSAIVYDLSVVQLDDSLHRQYAHLRVFDDNGFIGSPAPQQLDRELARGKALLAGRLIYFNLIILVVSSGASYWLARQTLRPIEEALEAQSRFTGDASHELRTPLTAMQTQIEVALRNPKLTAAQARNLLGSNLEEVSKLRALSDGLLRLARGDGKDIERRVISIDEVTTDALQRVVTAAQAKRIIIDNQAAPLQVRGDAPTLTDLVVILLDNAIKYSDSKSTVTIATRRHGGLVELQVRDTGVGIGAGDLPHIFERFYRADSSRSRQNVEGHGLGLSIAQKIAELHGAAISVASEPGKGSTFTVRLPSAGKT